MSNDYRHLREFGEFSIDLEKKVLWHRGAPLTITSKAVELLCALVENPGEVMTKDELLCKVWQDTFVEESVLTQNVYHLRRTFKELGLSENLIQTIPRRGYRFTGPDDNVNGELSIEREIVQRSLVVEVNDDELPDLNFAGRETAGSLSRRVVNYRPAIIFFIAACAFASVAIAVWMVSYRWDGSKFAVAQSIAVLPLKALTPIEGDDQLRFRITDALITRLGNIENLTVRPTSSILQFDKGDQDPVAAGKILRVESVVDGRVQAEGKRVRVTLQPGSVSSGEQLWSGQFDGRADEILELQDSIASSLRKEFSLQDRRELPPATDTKAYEAYLRGRYLWNLRTSESYWQALDYFRESVELDPNFALGYAGIADCYYLLNQRNVLKADDAFQKAEDAARNAIEKDPNSAEAHTSMGTVLALYHWRWREAEQHFKRAIELNANYAEAHARYGVTLTMLNRLDDGFIRLKEAERLDPTSLNIGIYLGTNLYFARKYDESIEQFNRILEFAPKTPTVYFHLSRIYERTGRFDEAFAANLEERSMVKPEWVEPLRLAYRKGGIRAFWLKQIELMKADSVLNPNVDYHIATRFALLGDPENAISYLEKNRTSRGGMWHAISSDPALDSLRSEPRLAALVQRLKFPGLIDGPN